MATRPTVRLLTGRLPLGPLLAAFGRPYHGDFSFLADAWAAAIIRGIRGPAIRSTSGASSRSRCSWPAGARRLASCSPCRWSRRWSPPRWREEFLRELRARPAGALRGDAARCHPACFRPAGRLHRPARGVSRSFASSCGADYRTETTIEDLTLFRRQAGLDRSVPPAAPSQTDQPEPDGGRQSVRRCRLPSAVSRRPSVAVTPLQNHEGIGASDSCGAGAVNSRTRR